MPKRPKPPEEAAKADNPSAHHFLKIEDLAARWRVSLDAAKKIVREGKVPFIALRSTDVRINWKLARFDPKAIESWEASRERVADEPEPSVSPLTGMYRLKHIRL